MLHLPVGPWKEVHDNQTSWDPIASEDDCSERFAESGRDSGRCLSSCFSLQNRHQAIIALAQDRLLADKSSLSPPSV